MAVFVCILLLFILLFKLSHFYVECVMQLPKH